MLSGRDIAGSMVKFLGLRHLGRGHCTLMGEGPLSKEIGVKSVQREQLQMQEETAESGLLLSWRGIKAGE